jgi:hypothetical protein
MAINFNTNNKEEESSFALLRTNPKLTSNLKLVVDSSEHIYLSAFKANKVLSKVEYQKFEVSDTGIYANDVARFFKGAPVDERFQTLRKHSDITPYSDYSYQYENQYNYGASFNSTKLYDEQYKIFAPIWLDRRIPKKFIVYRVSDVDYNSKYTEDTNGQNDRILELLESATIVKAFDLTRKSRIGKYLHSHVYDKGMPESAVEFNFSDSGAVLYRGIDSIKGGFVSKKDFIAEDYIQQDNLEINANEIVTKGFERHGVISANLINLEFMFDDASAVNYDIYRYFGLYVDDIEEGSFKINSISSDDIISIEPGSTHTVYDVIGAGITHEDMLPKTPELKVPVLSYINLGDNSFLHIRNNTEVYGLKIPVTSSIDIKNLLKNTNYTISNNKLQAISTKISNKPFIKFEITNKPITNDRFYIGDKTEIEINNYEMYGFMAIATDTIPAGTFSGNSFSSKGTLRQVAIAVSSLIKDISNYNTRSEGSSVIIEDYGNGDNRNRMSFGIYDLNISDFINIEAAREDYVGLQNYTGTQFSDWNLYTARGGSKIGASFLVNEDELGEASIGQYVKHAKLTKFSKVIDIVRDNINNKAYRVILDTEYKLPSDGTVQLYNKFTPTFGKFSAYQLKDFDFDFYSTKNSELGELAYESFGTNYNPLEKFTGLSSVLYQETSGDDPVLTDINSEYDRLNENVLKETALKSRIVPTIMKYSLKNGTNARNLPYILNVNEALGTNNISPEIKIESGRNYDNLNMEHFHFNKIPDSLHDNNTLSGLSSYTSFTTTDGISIDQLKSTDVDYFSLYFRWNGAVNQNTGIWVDDKSRNLYSKFNGGTSELESSTVFRGLRYIYKKRKESFKDTPTAFETSTDVNSYKFGVTLNYTKQSNESSGVKYHVIKNDTFKFICVFININVKDNIVDYLSRASVYELQDIKEVKKDNDGNPLLDVNGDPIINIIDTDLSFGIDLSSSTWPQDAGVETIVYASQQSISGGQSAFTKEITLNDEGKYSWIYFEYEVGGQQQFACMQVVSIINDDQIIVSGLPIPFTLEDGPLFSQAPLDDQFLYYIPTSTTFKYWQTGSAGWKNLLEEVVSYNFAKRFNNFGDVAYTRVNSEFPNEEFINDFVLQIEDGVDVVKPSVLDTSADGDRPRSYQLSSKEIGKILKEREDGGYFTLLRRFNGQYNPLFKDVVDFTDIYTVQSALIPDHMAAQGSGSGGGVGVGGNLEAIILPYPLDHPGQLSDAETSLWLQTIGISSGGEINLDRWRERLIYNKFKNQGIAFASYKNVNESYGYISNYHHHKVNDEDSKNLLKLSETSDKLPLYPAIGEIAIDKKDFNIFKSKYSSDYFVKSVPGQGGENVYGTLSPVELKSFMASTIMKVKDQYDLTSFSQTNETSLDSLDYIRFNKLNKTAIHWIENDSEIIADFYLPKTIYNELLEDGIQSKFSKYLTAENSFGDKSTILDDLEKYVYSNIVSRFIIENTEIYGISGKNITTEFKSVNSPKELTDGRFTKQTNFDIQGYQNDGLSFRLIYNKKPGFKYHLKLHIKIQA